MSHYRIKGYGEQEVIDAMFQRFDQKEALARTIAQLFWAEVWLEA
jgi:hypothetical protein